MICGEIDSSLVPVVSSGRIGELIDMGFETTDLRASENFQTKLDGEDERNVELKSPSNWRK